MFIAVVDTETTGDSETDQVVEIAVVPIRGDARVDRGSHQLVRPTCPVSPVARGVHHIADETLSSAPTMERLASRKVSLLNQLRNADYVAGHYVDFDLRLLAQSGFTVDKPKICTWRCARHLWPDAPSYGNQTLRYWRGVAVGKTTLPPHRAIFDALTTAALLRDMMSLFSAAELAELTSSPVLLTKVKFGKYEGKTWREVRLRDRGYLSWMLKQEFGEDERHTANYWLSKKREEIDDDDQGSADVLQVREEQTRNISSEKGAQLEGEPDARPDLPEV